MDLSNTTIFYSYSHKDEKFRDALETHLSVLARNNIISSWHDRKISAGKDWKKEIDTELETADIILLLVSADFIASDYCYEKELEVAMGRHESNQAVVIPIIVRPSDWSGTPFAGLQALPKDAKAVTTWNSEDEAWLDVVVGIKKAIEKVRSLRKRTDGKKGFRSIKEYLTSEIDELEEVFEKDEDQYSIRGLSTSLVDLDHITDGIHPSELVAIAGRPGMGKTDFAIQISATIAITTNQPVAYFSLNLPADKITRKLIASIGRLETLTLLKASLSDDEWPRLTSSVSILANIPFYIDDTITATLDELRRKAIEIKNTQNVELIVVDSLQHLVTNHKHGSSERDYSHVTKELSRLAREIKTPILVTTSINADVEKRINKRPLLSDLGSWRTLEEDGDTIIFIYRDDLYNYESTEKGVAELIVAKNGSGGPVGTVRVVYLNSYCRFENLVDDYLSESNA